jgi:hypothetical protein
MNCPHPILLKSQMNPGVAKSVKAIAIAPARIIDFKPKPPLGHRPNISSSPISKI